MVSHGIQRYLTVYLVSRQFRCISPRSRPDFPTTTRFVQRVKFTITQPCSVPFDVVCGMSASYFTVRGGLEPKAGFGPFGPRTYQGPRSLEPTHDGWSADVAAPHGLCGARQGGPVRLLAELRAAPRRGNVRRVAN